MAAHMNTAFFWLHVKKCGGQSFRETFTPPYVQTDRSKNPKPFIALPRAEWNDALNNYRIPLGEYDFKRMLFAKKYLYSEKQFSEMYKFVIVRNPFARVVSAWKYLTKKEKPLDEFVAALPLLWKKKSKFRRAATHTAPIWGDITDSSDSLLVDDIFRLESIDEQVSEICARLGIPNRRFQRINVTGENTDYRDCYSEKSKKMVAQLYADDIERLGYVF